MIFAQIKNNMIVNTIVINDVSLVPVFTTGFDYCIEISSLNTSDPLVIIPSIGWTYDGTTFTPPQEA